MTKPTDLTPFRDVLSMRDAYGDVVHEELVDALYELPLAVIVKEVERFRRIDKNLTEYRRTERSILGLPESANHTDHIEAIENLVAEVEALRERVNRHEESYWDLED